MEMVKPLDLVGDSFPHICYWIHGPFAIWEGGREYNSFYYSTNEFNHCHHHHPHVIQVGVRAIVYYLVTTVLAVILGIILVVTIRYFVIIIIIIILVVSIKYIVIIIMLFMVTLMMTIYHNFRKFS